MSSFPSSNMCFRMPLTEVSPSPAPPRQTFLRSAAQRCTAPAAGPSRHVCPMLIARGRLSTSRWPFSSSRPCRLHVFAPRPFTYRLVSPTHTRTAGYSCTQPWPPSNYPAPAPCCTALHFAAKQRSFMSIHRHTGAIQRNSLPHLRAFSALAPDTSNIVLGTPGGLNAAEEECSKQQVPAAFSESRQPVLSA